MTDMRGAVWTADPRQGSGLPWPLPAAALAGVRTRRMMAALVDVVIVGVLAFTIWLLLGLATFFMLWFILPPLFPIIAFFYNGITVSGWRMATPGMRMMDLEVRTMEGGPASFVHAAVHAVLFYVSWMLPVVFLVSLLNSEKRCLHDMFSNLIVLRRADR